MISTQKKDVNFLLLSETDASRLHTTIFLCILIILLVKRGIILTFEKNDILAFVVTFGKWIETYMTMRSYLLTCKSTCNLSCCWQVLDSTKWVFSFTFSFLLRSWSVILVVFEWLFYNLFSCRIKLLSAYVIVIPNYVFVSRDLLR